MKKVIILEIIIISLIIIICYRHVPTNTNSNSNDDENTVNSYTSIYDLYEYPTEFNNKSVKIKGIISEVDWGNFATGGEGLPDQIKSGFSLYSNQSSNYPPKKSDWKNGESLPYFGHSSPLIWIYSENISFVECLNKTIVIEGYLRNITDKNPTWGETDYWYYIEVFGITLFENDKKT